MSQEEFGGVIGRSYQSSQPWIVPEPSAPPGAPNVVIIVLDDVGFGHLGCYGSTIETPRIDALAAAGRRYNNFHTTAMCSPTRASLLTGRNHHAVGMGMIADWCTGYPGYQGQVTRRAATLAEMLQPAGYNCFAVGKWHLARLRDWTAAGPFGQWPLGRGFERYYGFLASLMDHWNPELVCDNHAIPTPRRPGYHLTEDLIERAIGMIGDQQAAAPGKPFFSYVALGACHSPHHAPRSHIDKYAGRFDDGWDVARERWFARQLELGIVPAGSRLTPRNEAVRPWDSMSPDERRLCARHQEVFAGFLDHADQQIGRMVDYLEQRGLLDNTLLMVLSDNGATEEGGDFGDANIRRHYQFLDEPLEQKLAALEQLGSEHLFNNYPRGWGHAGNTPLKWFKMHTHGGGVRDPLVVHWPARIKQGGLVSAQFCHCSDIVPTVLEAVGLTAPATVQGVEQMPVHGTSFLHSFDEPRAPGRKKVQYFELLGHRGIWADGWKAVTHHVQGSDYDSDRWELYHVDADFTESEDVAERHPEKLRQLVELWWEQAQMHHVLPLDDRDRQRILLTYKLAPRRRYVFEPGMDRLAVVAAPPVANRSYRIVADVELAPGSAGVILAAGTRFGGYVLFVEGGRLVHEYVGPDRRWVIESGQALAPGRHLLEFEFARQGHCAGTGILLCDGAVLGRIEMRNMWPLGATAGGVYCGYDDGSPVSERYQCPFNFTGTIHQVVVELADDQLANSGLENMLSISED
ncbi:arylsulfatase [Lacisediminimonas sp.]|uniref:arylsulfatase n=1 Tax=Lacisediminimonas sp. TaxID=3060582 RepID=UPI0027205162|nr:arylsulfatase [Lacisediminimonas sp.]MDO8300794.1 arylsulfatase [Lacisediminimonas sp.]